MRGTNSLFAFMCVIIHVILTQLTPFPSTSRFFAFHLAYNLYIPGPSMKKCQSTGDTSGSVPHGRHRLDDAAKCLGGTSGVSKSDC